MTNKIIEVLKELFNMNSNEHRTGLDAYIAEHNPQDNYDVEHLEREYYKKQSQALHRDHY